MHYPLTEEGINAAFEAVKSVHELVIDSVKYSCRVSHALEQYLKNQGRYGPGGFIPQQQQAPPPNFSLPATNSGFSSYFDRGFQPPTMAPIAPPYPNQSFFMQQEFSTYGGLTPSYTQPQLQITPPQAVYSSYSHQTFGSANVGVIAPPYQVPTATSNMDLIAMRHSQFTNPNTNNKSQQQFPGGGSGGSGGGLGGL